MRLIQKIIYEDNLSARVPVEGTIPKDILCMSMRTQMKVMIWQKELSNPFLFSKRSLKAKELYTVLWYMSRG